MIENIAQQILQMCTSKKVHLVAMCGAADLGKTYLCHSLREVLLQKGQRAEHLTMDSYLIPRRTRIELGISGYNKEAYRTDALLADIRKLLNNQAIFYQAYDHELGVAGGPSKRLDPSPILILDGLHSMLDSIMPFVDYSIFVFTSDSKLMQIRQQADKVKRNVSPELSAQHLQAEFRRYKKFVEPYKNRADMLVELTEKWHYTMQQG